METISVTILVPLFFRQVLGSMILIRNHELKVWKLLLPNRYGQRVLQALVGRGSAVSKHSPLCKVERLERWKKCSYNEDVEDDETYVFFNDHNHMCLSLQRNCTTFLVCWDVTSSKSYMFTQNIYGTSSLQGVCFWKVVEWRPLPCGILWRLSSVYIHPWNLTNGYQKVSCFKEAPFSKPFLVYIHQISRACIISTCLHTVYRTYTCFFKFTHMIHGIQSCSCIQCINAMIHYKVLELYNKTYAFGNSLWPFLSMTKWPLSQEEKTRPNATNYTMKYTHMILPKFIVNLENHPCQWTINKTIPVILKYPLDSRRPCVFFEAFDPTIRRLYHALEKRKLHKRRLLVVFEADFGRKSWDIPHPD